MRRRSISAATTLAVVFSSAVIAAGSAGVAVADSAKVLAVKSVGDLVVDGVHQRVYVSDPTGGKIVVTDYAGAVKATLTGLSGVSGLALSADSGQLYAAVKSGNRIVSVETGTYTQTASYPVGAAPTDLEVVDGRIWFGYGTNFGSLDVSGAEPVVHLAQRGDVDFFGGTTLLGSDPAAPGVLVAGTGGGLAVYDVSADGAVLRTKGDMDTSVKQIDLTPDGKQVLTSWGDPDFGYGIGAYSTADLTEQTGYPIDAYPNAVQVAPDGSVAGGSFSWYEPDVHIHRPGDPTPVREYDFPNTGDSSGADTLVDGALAWAPDSSRVFAVSVNDGGAYTLRTLTDPTKELPTLKVTAPAKADRAKKLTVTGKLASKTALPAGTGLKVTRTDLESPSGKALAAVTTKADGSFSFTDTPPAGGKVVYKVTYAGDAAHAAVSGSDAVTVSRKATALTLTNNGKLYAYGKDVAFTAHLGSTYKNRTVAIYSDPFGSDKPKKLVKTAKVNSKGNLSAVVDMTRDTTVTAVFAGDARSAEKTAKSTAYAHAKVSTTVSKHYKTGKIGSTTYYYFHKNTAPVLTTTMNYYQGRKQRLQLQVYYQGSWYDSGSEYFALATDGRSAVSLGAPGESGIRARVRSSYINGTSGDSVNSTTHGAWKYLNFTN
ncbi:SMP-30/gluconolactonase/LRE family protein [Streptomyces sp. NBC_01275]|uniref:YncE family protein n=1 Tax=Streptomyces sp. NBC_01275 TaxID=2903807 RepID=UPI0022523F78|nr:Ig-like domain repeat protein [Streptomyces sp. NBC_01275]MCX4762741.1 SMP-30/gluconolactonase/LRE family protein [Streptomyces sp. NBC_01275]